MLLWSCRSDPRGAAGPARCPSALPTSPVGLPAPLRSRDRFPGRPGQGSLGSLLGTHPVPRPRSALSLEQSQIREQRLVAARVKGDGYSHSVGTAEAGREDLPCGHGLLVTPAAFLSVPKPSLHHNCSRLSLESSVAPFTKPGTPPHSPEPSPSPKRPAAPLWGVSRSRACLGTGTPGSLCHGPAAARLPFRGRPEPTVHLVHCSLRSDFTPASRPESSRLREQRPENPTPSLPLLSPATCPALPRWPSPCPAPSCRSPLIEPRRPCR